MPERGYYRRLGLFASPRKGITKYVLFFCTAVMATMLAMPALAFAATPAKVTGVKASAGITAATITWSTAKYATYYYVYRGSTYVGRVSAKSTRRFVATGLAAGGSYTFKVRAKSSTGRYGSYSSSVAAKTHPTDLVNLVGDYVAQTLTWDVSPGAAKYLVTGDFGTDVLWTKTVTGTTADLSMFKFDNAPIFTVTPVSSYGVAGTFAGWLAIPESSTNYIDGEGIMKNVVTPISADSYVITLNDTGTGIDYTVLVDLDSFIDQNPDANTLTPTEFVNFLQANPTRLVSWYIREDAAKTAGTGADYCLDGATVLENTLTE